MRRIAGGKGGPAARHWCGLWAKAGAKGRAPWDGPAVRAKARLTLFSVKPSPATSTAYGSR
jgi:hypothetical protein